jgi:ADP-ribosylglycohydrolase
MEEFTDVFARVAYSDADRGSGTSPRDRCVGAMLGLAAGDALGTTVQFKAPGSFKPITDMLGGGPFKLNAGQWTDDTAMALCLAESLLKCGGFDTGDQMTRYVRWWRNGHWSSTGTCVDIGNTTRDALSRFVRTGDTLAGSTAKHAAGNGSLMRLAPVPLFFSRNPMRAIAMAGVSSRTTHGTTVAIDACRYFAGLIVGAVNEVSKDELLSPGYCPVRGLWNIEPLHEDIEAIAQGSFHLKQPPVIRGTGYVVDCLEAALWAFATTDDFQSGALAAVNLGDDADTTGAVYGQIAGAYYGVDSIPSSWREKITFVDEIIDMGERLSISVIPGR